MPSSIASSTIAERLAQDVAAPLVVVGADAVLADRAAAGRATPRAAAQHDRRALRSTARSPAGPTRASAGTATIDRRRRRPSRCSTRSRRGRTPRAGPAPRATASRQLEHAVAIGAHPHVPQRGFELANAVRGGHRCRDRETGERLWIVATGCAAAAQLAATRRAAAQQDRPERVEHRSESRVPGGNEPASSPATASRGSLIGFHPKTRSPNVSAQNATWRAQ